MLIMNATAATTVVLPPIPPVLPTPPGTPGTSPGIGDGFVLTIRNNSTNAITVSAASGDTLGDALQLGGVGSVETVMAVLGSKTWYRMVNPNGPAAVTSKGAAYTVQTSDRYLITTTATTITLQAPSVYPANQPFVTIINASSGSDTITPASGTLYGAASLTLATKVSSTFLTDGTNWYLVASA
jgi:hypothetical protein